MVQNPAWEDNRCSASQ